MSNLPAEESAVLAANGEATRRHARTPGAKLMHALLPLALLAAHASAESTFVEPFDALREGLWVLSAGGSGKAAVADGRLTLDMSEPKRGKWAFAELHQAITLPARIEWDQCLAHDSPHTYFAGVLVMTARR
jgi:hypothetical protein